MPLDFLETDTLLLDDVGALGSPNPLASDGETLSAPEDPWWSYGSGKRFRGVEDATFHPKESCCGSCASGGECEGGCSDCGGDSCACDKESRLDSALSSAGGQGGHGMGRWAGASFGDVGGAGNEKCWCFVKKLNMLVYGECGRDGQGRKTVVYEGKTYLCHESPRTEPQFPLIPIVPVPSCPQECLDKYTAANACFASLADASGAWAGVIWLGCTNLAGQYGDCQRNYPAERTVYCPQLVIPDPPPNPPAPAPFCCGATPVGPGDCSDYGPSDTLSLLGYEVPMECVCRIGGDTPGANCLRGCLKCMKSTGQDYKERGHEICKRCCKNSGAWTMNDEDAQLAAALACGTSGVVLWDGVVILGGVTFYQAWKWVWF